MEDTEEGRRQSRIAHRTAQLSRSSRFLHRIDHFASLPSTAMVVIVVLVGSAALGAGLGFPSRWFAWFEAGAAAVTLLMVFTIQHTQAREQAATQRKLDELIRALPGASEKLMMLEEAPNDFLQEVEEDQRDSRTVSVTE
jgi:low affinity Fe/Cu permease